MCFSLTCSLHLISKQALRFPIINDWLRTCGTSESCLLLYTVNIAQRVMRRKASSNMQLTVYPGYEPKHIQRAIQLSSNLNEVKSLVCTETTHPRFSITFLISTILSHCSHEVIHICQTTELTFSSENMGTLFLYTQSNSLSCFVCSLEHQ